MSVFRQLNVRTLTENIPDLVRSLYQTLEEFKDEMNRRATALSFGPVPGSYLAISFDLDKHDTSSVAAADEAYRYLAFESELVYLSVMSDGDVNANFEFTDDETSTTTTINITTMRCVGSTAPSGIDTHSLANNGFALRKLTPGRVSMVVDATFATTEHLSGLMIVRNVGNPANYS